MAAKISKFNRNGNVLTKTVYDQSDIATLFKAKTWSDYSEEGWRWIVERLVTSHKVPEGGHLSFFSLFLALIFV